MADVVQIVLRESGIKCHERFVAKSWMRTQPTFASTRHAPEAVRGAVDEWHSAGKKGVAAWTRGRVGADRNDPENFFVDWKAMPAPYAGDLSDKVSVETIEKLVQVGLVIRAAAQVDTSLTWPNLREFLSAQDWKTITADVVDKMACDEVEDSVPGSIAPEWYARTEPFESGGEVKKRRLGLNSGGCKTEDGITGTEAVAEVGKEAGVETSAHFHGYGRSWYQRWQEEDQRSWEDGREARLDSRRGPWERTWAQAVEQAASSKEQPGPAEGSAGGNKTLVSAKEGEAGKASEESDSGR